MRTPCFPLLIGLAGGAAVLAAQAEEAPLNQEQIAFFESKIRPALVEYCYECHSTTDKIRGGLALDSRDGLRHGGDSGEALVPGDPEQSLLFTAVSWADPDYQMPPKQKLPASVIADFRQWIEMGAPDPRVTEAVTVQSKIDLEKGRQFWSFQKPVQSPPPAVKEAGWANSGIDRFVLAKLEEHDLKPSGDAEPTTLLRRLHVDLIGLPPSPRQVNAFLSAWRVDPAKAIEAKVDELLASRQFGERWGQHWLDVARYAESTGKEINVLFPHAWRYRDYVIDAFNADKPYDRFVREQIAGDLLPIKSDEDWQQNLIATGFLALGTKGLNEPNARQFRMDLVDEQIDATFQAFQGLTVACARCHDHKSDPVPTTDYYALAGIFLSTETYFGTVNQIQNQRATDLLLLPIADKTPLKSYTAEEIGRMRVRLQELETELNEARAQDRQQRMQAMRDGSAPAQNNLQTILRLTTQVSQLRALLNGLDEQGNLKTFAMGTQDKDQCLDATVLIRGELDKPAQQVPRGMVQVLSGGETPAIPENASGRLQLAEWLASKENPLTARVMVNRVWQHLFGKGLVASPDNFGATGTAPTHPELLDYLAVHFMENGWSVKSLIRELVLTRTYQMSSDYSAANYQRDPDNHYLWRAEPRRLDAEALRDAMLAAGGNLDLERPRGSIVAEIGDSAIGVRVGAGNLDRPVTYRSIYLPRVRDSLPEALALFDAADGTVVTGSRDSTNVPSQSLYLMNDPFVVQQGEAMARRIVEQAQTPRERFALAFVIAYGRTATSDEVESAMTFFQRFIPRAAGQLDGGREQAGFLAFSAFCQGLMASAEFRYLN